MNSLRGLQWKSKLLVELKRFFRRDASDQQVGHSAYAMMEFSGISPEGRKMWDMANHRVKQISILAKNLRIQLD